MTLWPSLLITQKNSKGTHPVGFQRLSAVLLPLLEAVAALGLVEDVGRKFSAFCRPGHGSHGSRTHSATMVGISFGHTLRIDVAPRGAAGSLLVQDGRRRVHRWLAGRSRCPAGGRTVRRCGTRSTTTVHWRSLARKLLLLLSRRNAMGLGYRSERATNRHTEPLRRGRSSPPDHNTQLCTFAELSLLLAAMPSPAAPLALARSLLVRLQR